MQLLGNMRALNTVEMSHLFSIIDTNLTGMQLMAGFAQSAKEKDVRDHFMRGKELARKIIRDMGGVLLQ
jgi:hypothetical protein